MSKHGIVLPAYDPGRTYASNRPCHKHGPVRRLRNGKCVECAAEAYAELAELAASMTARQFLSRAPCKVHGVPVVRARGNHECVLCRRHRVRVHRALHRDEINARQRERMRARRAGSWLDRE